MLTVSYIFIFTFAGTSNQNYMSYMLDLTVGKFVEGDLMQEWNNRWLEDIAGRRGGQFDEEFYRKTVAPNVLHFPKMKEDVETAFDLKRRGKAHTPPPPHLRDEMKILLQLYKDEELHQFRSGPSMGHAAVNRFDRGYERLNGEKMKEYLQRSAEYAQMVRDMELLRTSAPSGVANSDSITVSDKESDESSSESSRSSSPSSSSSCRSSGSAVSRAAADSVQGWDDVDHSDEALVSGSDMTATSDPHTGRLYDHWYEPEEFEA
ncbi:hypothetical protein B0H14DRAFT_3449895 [Mycena olivaceomarginata]|nr:hypothetical protein B0H14DRAFT_3449895 [Mycena olivaceomarginata]